MFEIIIGILAGIISGLGMGGGTILILLLTIFLEIPQNLAQSTNLFFFIPTAISAIIINAKNKKIDFNISKYFILLGIVGSIVGSYISIKISVKTLKKIFGVFLILIAIYQTYEYKKLKKRDNTTNYKK